MALDWSRAASSLVLFGGAMVARAVVLVVVVAQLLRGELTSISLAFGLAVALGEIATTIVGATALVRFGNAAPQPARKQASFAALCFAGVIAAEGYELWVGLRMRELSAHGLGEVSLAPELAAHVARLPTVGMIATVAAFFGAIQLLLAIASIAEQLHSESLARRAGDLVLALVGFGLAYGIVMSWPGAGWISIASLLGVAAFGLGTLAAYAWLISRIVRVMRAA